MRYSYYIYYRIAPTRLQEANARARDLLTEMKKSTAITGRLLKKHGEPALWMEIYEDVKDTTQFERTLEEVVRRLQASEFLQAGTARHVECFESE